VPHSSRTLKLHVSAQHMPDATKTDASSKEAAVGCSKAGRPITVGTKWSVHGLQSRKDGCNCLGPVMEVQSIYARSMNDITGTHLHLSDLNHTVSTLRHHGIIIIIIMLPIKP
jgi:hypothetical protein